jgi:hypothetical protein
MTARPLHPQAPVVPAVLVDGLRGGAWQLQGARLPAGHQPGVVALVLNLSVHLVAGLSQRWEHASPACHKAAYLTGAF